MSGYKEITRKIITLQEAEELFTHEFRLKNRIVFTNGCFDLLHRGHVYYLSRAREMGDVLVVGLNSDSSVSKLKGANRPVNDQQARAEVLGALTSVSYIIVFPEETPLNLICTVKPHFLVKGGDYKEEDIVGFSEVISWQGEVQTIPLLKGYSTSSILKKST
ncbi:MAG: D-glycero-beta-D-manno-heptose 1-phosphate adenylyltransferase [Bacteroidetes bacterium]|nr:MAG: D-glycero-beta-D-manno-heptose 1-phosphate adenylyltransferase [Bacteroidota bacterium]